MLNVYAYNPLMTLLRSQDNIQSLKLRPQFFIFSLLASHTVQSHSEGLVWFPSHLMLYHISSWCLGLLHAVLSFWNIPLSYHQLPHSTKLSSFTTLYMKPSQNVSSNSFCVSSILCKPFLYHHSAVINGVYLSSW